LQGVKQPYKISITTKINQTSINFELSVYPNPTNNYLIFKTETIENLDYLLFNLERKLIENKKVIKNNTTIQMAELPKKN
tara:strand:- start:2938 stop:3177 length:240 start_codon:yes stop_codon:yes gene_type:complete